MGKIYSEMAKEWEPIITSIENIERLSGPNAVGSAEDNNLKAVRQYIARVEKQLRIINKAIERVSLKGLHDSSTKRRDNRYTDFSKGEIIKKLAISIGVGAGIGLITGLFFKAIKPHLDKYYTERGKKAILNGEVSEPEYINGIKKTCREMYLSILSNENATPEDKKKATEVMNKLGSVRTAKDLIRVFPNEPEVKEMADLFEVAKNHR